MRKYSVLVRYVVDCSYMYVCRKHNNNINRSLSILGIIRFLKSKAPDIDVNYGLGSLSQDPHKIGILCIEMQRNQ